MPQIRDLYTQISSLPSYAVPEMSDGAIGELTAGRPYPQHLGSGATMAVFEIEPGVVAKLPISSSGDTLSERRYSVRESAAALRQGAGMPCLEQVIGCVDRGNCVAVLSETAKGSSFNAAVKSGKVPSVSDLERVVDGYKAMDILGLRADNNDSQNLRFDSQQGYTILDYTTEAVYRYQQKQIGEEYRPETLMDKMRGLIDEEGLLRYGASRREAPPIAIGFLGICEERLGFETASRIARLWRHKHALWLPPNVHQKYIEDDEF